MTRSLVLMTGTKNVADIIWVPDTVFINSVDAKMHDVTVHNNKLDIEPNGDVFWGTRLVLNYFVFCTFCCIQMSFYQEYLRNVNVGTLKRVFSIIITPDFCVYI